MSDIDADEEYFALYPYVRDIGCTAAAHFEKYGARLGYKFSGSGKGTAQLSRTSSNQIKSDPDAIALCVHIYYIELVEEIATLIEGTADFLSADLFLTLPYEWSDSAVRYAMDRLRPVHLTKTENIGRDVWPFLQILEVVRSRGYKTGCKLHSKKSLHLAAGENWRQTLYSSLLGRQAIQDVLLQFEFDDRVGILGPEGSKASCKDINTIVNNRRGMEIVAQKYKLDLATADAFIAGTMFWFKVDAFNSIEDGQWNASDFGIECGETDGTLAHAFERLFPLIAERDGYSLKFYQGVKVLNPYA